MVNEELWNEARTYMDIQLMPFVDYYSLIAWKTIAICVFGVKSCTFLIHGVSRARLADFIYCTDGGHFSKVCHEDR